MSIDVERRSSDPAHSTSQYWKKEKITAKSGTYAPVLGDGCILCDTSGGNVTINLPSASGQPEMRLSIQKDHASNLVTITPNGGDTINGLSSWVLRHIGDSVIICSDGSSDWLILSIHEPNTTEFFNVEPNANLGNHRVRNIAGTGGHRFEFRIPDDFLSLNSLSLICVPGSGTDGSGKDIDLHSDYFSSNEAYNNHTESDTTSTYDFTGQLNKGTELDVTAVFTNISAGDKCGLFVDHNSIGGTISYIGIEIDYRRRQ
jgi:hypothetical protein